MIVLVDGVLKHTGGDIPTQPPQYRQIINGDVFSAAQGSEFVSLREDAYWSRFQKGRGGVDTLYIVKRHNAGKADTHHRFFELIREMQHKPPFVGLTDTGTIIGDYCIDKLVRSFVCCLSTCVSQYHDQIHCSRVSTSLQVALYVMAINNMYV